MNFKIEKLVFLKKKADLKTKTVPDCDVSYNDYL